MKMKNEKTIEEELTQAEEYLSSHPVLAYSPGDLRRQGKTPENYLKQWTPEERELWHSYYSDEL